MGGHAVQGERMVTGRKKINAKTLSKITALHCKCTVLIFKFYFIQLTFKVMVIKNIDYTDGEKPLGVRSLMSL